MKAVAIAQQAALNRFHSSNYHCQYTVSYALEFFLWLVLAIL
jgi:hypothetical protein